MKATHPLMEEIQYYQQQNQQHGTTATDVTDSKCNFKTFTNPIQEISKQIVQDLCCKTISAIQTIS